MSLQYISDLESLQCHSHNSPILSICWANNVILSGDSEGCLKAWNPDTAIGYEDFPQPHSNATVSITANRAGTSVLTSSIDGSIALWDVSSFHQVNHNSNGNTQEGSIETDQSKLPLPTTSSGSSSSLLVASIESLHSKALSKQISVSEAWSTALHPTYPIFASVGIGARISLHSADSSNFGSLLMLADFPPTSNASKSAQLFGTRVSFNFPDGNLVAVATDSGQVFLYSLHFAPSSQLPSLQLVSTYADHAAPVRTISFAPNQHLLIASDDRSITVHDVRRQTNTYFAAQDSGSSPPITTSSNSIGTTVASLQGHRGWIMDVKSSPSSDGRIIATSSTDKTIKLWDLATTPKTCVCTCSESDQIWCLDWKPDLHTLPSLQTERVIDQTASSASASQTQRLMAKEEPAAAGGSAQASKFVTGGHDGCIRLYRGAGL